MSKLLWIEEGVGAVPLSDRSWGSLLLIGALAFGAVYYFIGKGMTWNEMDQVVFAITKQTALWSDKDPHRTQVAEILAHMDEISDGIEYLKGWVRGKRTTSSPSERDGIRYLPFLVELHRSKVAAYRIENGRRELKGQWIMIDSVGEEAWNLLGRARERLHLTRGKERAYREYAFDDDEMEDIRDYNYPPESPSNLRKMYAWVEESKRRVRTPEDLERDAELRRKGLMSNRRRR